MQTPYGELSAGAHTIGDVVVTVNATETGWTESPISIPSPRFVAPYDFRKLFTQEERILIYGSQDGLVRDFLGALQTITTQVDLQDLETIQSVGYLAMTGLIAPERVDAILSGQAPE